MDRSLMLIYDRLLRFIGSFSTKFFYLPLIFCYAVTQVKSESELAALSAKLTENSVQHKLWIEQPENYPTCLAVKPYPKDDVKNYFKKLKLLK